MNHAVNWEAISAIGQIVGALPVVISLIYVATEVRSGAHATQLASRHSMEDIFIRWAQQLADNQNLRELYYRGLHDFESLEGARRLRCTGARAVSTLRGSLLSTLGGAS